VPRRRGRIVNLVGDPALGPSPIGSEAACSDAATLRLTDSLALAAWPQGISVFALSPGRIGGPADQEPDEDEAAQIEDRLLLPLKDAVHRAAARIVVLEAAGLPHPRPPAMRADVGEVKHPARPGVRPAIVDGAVDQPQQLELGPGAHARGDRAEKPERCLPR